MSARKNSRGVAWLEVPCPVCAETPESPSEFRHLPSCIKPAEAKPLPGRAHLIETLRAQAAAEDMVGLVSVRPAFLRAAADALAAADQQLAAEPYESERELAVLLKAAEAERDRLAAELAEARLNADGHKMRAEAAEHALRRIMRNAENNGDEFTRMLAVAAVLRCEGDPESIRQTPPDAPDGDSRTPPEGRSDEGGDGWDSRAPGFSAGAEATSESVVPSSSEPSPATRQQEADRGDPGSAATGPSPADPKGLLPGSSTSETPEGGQ